MDWTELIAREGFENNNDWYWVKPDLSYGSCKSIMLGPRNFHQFGRALIPADINFFPKEKRQGVGYVIVETEDQVRKIREKVFQLWSECVRVYIANE